MIETITPAVCGSRRRHRIALALFTVAAVLTAALLGAALGLAGSLLGTPTALFLALAVAVLAALREARVVRFPLPQSRRQVPERWHAELPLPLWAVGYGAGLGAGVFTFQPVATFWVASAAALALGRPVAGAACFSLYGAGRALMVVLPRCGADEPGAAVERLARGRPALLRVNATLLAGVVVALAFAASAGAVPLDVGPGSQYDPAVTPGAIAYTQRDGTSASVVVHPNGESPQTFAGRTPALSGTYLAFADATGVRVVRWRQRATVASVPGASRPALEWPWLAYRADRFDGGRELWLENLETGERTRVVNVGPRTDLGRPALGGGRLAWNVVTTGGSRIGLLHIATGRRSVLARSKIAFLAHPSLTPGRAAWIEQRQGRTLLRLRRFDRRTATTLRRTHSRDEIFWSTALAGRNAYVSRWYVPFDLAQLERFRF